MKLKFQSETSLPLSLTSPDVFCKTIQDKVVVALPERLFCNDDMKLLQIIILIMPQLFENYLTSIKGDHFKPHKKQIEISGLQVSTLIYHTKDNHKVFILPTKDPDKGVYMLEIWQEKCHK